MPHEQLMLVTEAPYIEGRYTLTGLQFLAEWEGRSYAFSLGEDTYYDVRDADNVVWRCKQRLTSQMQHWSPVFAGAQLPHELIRILAVSWTPSTYYRHLSMSYRVGEDEEVTLRLF